MEFKGGRFYRTRDFHKARIRAINSVDRHIYGAIQIGLDGIVKRGREWRPCEWFPDGSKFDCLLDDIRYQDSEEEDDDLIADWIDPIRITSFPDVYKNYLKLEIEIEMDEYPLYGTARHKSGWSERFKSNRGIRKIMENIRKARFRSFIVGNQIFLDKKLGD